MKKFFIPVILVLATMMFSSCIIIGDFEDTKKVRVINNDSSTYITDVYYVEADDYYPGYFSNWTRAWSTKSTSRTVATFPLEPGEYYFFVYLSSNNKNDEIRAISKNSIYIGTFSSNTIEYNGGQYLYDASF